RLDQCERRVRRRHTARLQMRHERRDVLAQPTLRDGELGHILTATTLIHSRAVANPIECARDDVTLTLDELARLLATFAAATAARWLWLALTIRHSERTDIHEVHVA